MPRINKDRAEQNLPVVPIEHKLAMSIEEAAAYSGIGIIKLRKMTADVDCPFVLWIGTKRIIKRKAFEQYIEQSYSI